MSVYLYVCSVYLPQESEAKSKVDRIVEEYRRYKVRVEIARKQKETDLKLPVPGALGDYSSSSTTGANNNNTGGVGNVDNYEQEMSKWVRAYENLSRENEQLRTQNGDSFLIKNWQDRYEECLKEKEDLLAKLKVFSRLSETHHLSANSVSSPGSGSLRAGTTSTGAVSTGSDRRTPEQMYIDLMDEHKEYRRRVEALLTQRKEEVAELRNLIELNGLSDLLPSGDGTKGTRTGNSSSGSSSGSSGGLGYNGSMSPNSFPQHTGGPMVLNFQDSKIMYIRQMFLQYLSCRDEVVRPHIQAALIAMFRFNEQERLSIEEASKEEAPLEETLTAISSFFESFTGAALPLSVL